MLTVCADLSIDGVKSSLFNALSLATTAVYAMNDADYLLRTNAGDMKKINNHLDITNTH